MNLPCFTNPVLLGRCQGAAGAAGVLPGRCQGAAGALPGALPGSALDRQGRGPPEIPDPEVL